MIGATAAATTGTYAVTGGRSRRTGTKEIERTSGKRVPTSTATAKTCARIAGTGVTTDATSTMTAL